MDNFQAYGEFARVYDMFQDNVDYQTWGKWLKQQLAAQGITDGLVLDLGCGTGTMTEILAEAGYDMIGVDNSGEMLAEGKEKMVTIHRVSKKTERRNKVRVHFLITGRKEGTYE